MRLNLTILGLPASILLLLLTSHTIAASPTQDDQFPAQLQSNLPIQAKRWPADSPQRRRQLEAVEEHLRLGRSPVGVLKMSDDEGEKFYMDYWQFEGESDQGRLPDTSTSLRTRDEEEEAILLVNASAVVSFRPPFALHTGEQPDLLNFEDLRARKAIEGRNAAAVLAMLEKRGFVCPTGTANCSDINQPNYCCPITEVCFAIQDTGKGPVGCCPNGSSCGGTISGCASPNTPCDDSMGGGCCIPNYVCAGVGCVINQTLVVTTVITQTITVSESSSGRSTQTTTIVSTLTSSTISTTVTSDSSFSTSTSGTATGVAPVRGTGTTTSSSTAQLTGSATLCPTGFYACSAYYAGGCCRTGRNCDTTSCPATSSTTIVSSGVTIVVPVGAAATLTSPTAACATGWMTCDPTLGGNCCPSNWQCGSASCSSVEATATAYMQKASPNDGMSSRRIGAFGAMIIAFIIGLIIV